MYTHIYIRLKQYKLNFVALSSLEEAYNPLLYLLVIYAKHIN